MNNRNRELPLSQRIIKLTLRMNHSLDNVLRNASQTITVLVAAQAYIKGNVKRDYNLRAISLNCAESILQSLFRDMGGIRNRIMPADRASLILA